MNKPMTKRIHRLPLFATALFALITIQFSTISAQDIWEGGSIENGQSLFNANCASCHKVTSEVLAAPGLAGVSERWGTSDELLLQWVQDPKGAAESGDPYIRSLVERYVGTYGWMTGQAVSEGDLRDIMSYVANPPDVEAVVDNSDACPTDEFSTEADSDYSSMLWFLVLLILFLVIALSASGVKRALTDIIAEEKGQELLPDSSYLQRFRAWAWNNFIFVALICVFCIAYGVSVGYGALMGIGVYEGYSPDQPIKFIHSVHACENEIDCNYCHSSANNSKHAGIPSTNVCMNCHKAVKEGKQTGTEEISKIYEAIGFDAETGTYLDGDGNNGYSEAQESYKSEPIKWNKVHNLPDHVYFSHQQHVNVGELQCQNCHGDVASFSVGRIAPVDEINGLVDAFPGLIQLSKPTLTMGWCIECHNKADIDMASSGYYTEMHERLMTSERGNEELRRYLEDDKITVRELGGWECSKCHY
jgi:mono/diheme cytochrome c family protein